VQHLQASLVGEGLSIIDYTLYITSGINGIYMFPFELKKASFGACPTF
jgi:hypothetical protein